MVKAKPPVFSNSCPLKRNRNCNHMERTSVVHSIYRPDMLRVVATGLTFSVTKYAPGQPHIPEGTTPPDGLGFYTSLLLQLFLSFLYHLTEFFTSSKLSISPSPFNIVISFISIAISFISIAISLVFLPTNRVLYLLEVIHLTPRLFMFHLTFRGESEFDPPFQLSCRSNLIPVYLFEQFVHGKPYLSPLTLR